MMGVPAAMSKNLEAHMDELSKMVEIVCDKYYNKENNKLSNLCK